LIENCGAGLLEFSFILAYILGMGDLTRKTYLPNVEKLPEAWALKGLRERLQNWHNKTIELILECGALLYGSEGRMAAAFDQRLKLIRTKALMKGDDCCHFRWVWEG
jgi:hypothetical protein